MDPDYIFRKNILNLKPYSSARDEYSASQGIFLDANENAFAAKLNRYPDPHQVQLKAKIAQIKKTDAKQIFLGNGSDEAIDLLIRACCEPGRDNVILCPPTYGMYSVSAAINGVLIHEAPLSPDFGLDEKGIFAAINDHTKLIFLCSPNNPTGNCMDAEIIERILDQTRALLIIDEAYIDFCPSQTWLNRLTDYDNLVLLQTFSKAWGLAAIRLGLAFAHPRIIKTMNNIKYPYNINEISQRVAFHTLAYEAKKDDFVARILEQRAWLESELGKLEIVERIFPSQANFLLVRFRNAGKIYADLLRREIIIRNRSGLIHCENCLRITVGTPQENKELLLSLKKMEKQ